MKPRTGHTRRTLERFVLWCAALVLLIAGSLASRPSSAALNQGPGGPILVVTSSTSTFGDYYAEILRNEGFNAFAVTDISGVDATVLAAYDVVVLAKTALNAAQVTLFSNWVSGGGNLIAMSPGPELAALLGLNPLGTTLSNGYLLVNTSSSPGSGIIGETIQFHGTADRYSLGGATTVATLYSSATAATSSPAVTLRTVGAGRAAAFTYDLATSIVYSRQGNPAWATQERDGFSPIRSDDKYFGNASGDPQPDWIDLTKVAIPQADEQQRLLGNLIQHMNGGKKPLPRFWYFPHGKKAVVIMTGDDHGNGGTAGRFEQLKASSPAGCSVADWQCLRGTSYIYDSTPLSNAQASAYHAEGFEIGLHINTACADFTPQSLQDDYESQLAAWQGKYASLPAPTTQRHHCITWSDWATAAQVQLAHGQRLDTSYYFWPPGWVANTPGLFTGSAMPMRFSTLTGSLIDVYQATTQMTDESGQSYPFTIDTLLDRAIGPPGFYGAYTVNAHTDLPTTPESGAVISSALARGVPVVSSRQMLVWLDGRNASTFGSLSWSGSALSFTLSAGPATNGLQAMLPVRFGSSFLISLTRGGTAVPFTASTVKGVDYAFFPGIGGSYVATYGTDTAGPSVISTSPAEGTTGVPVAAVVTATFSEALNESTVTTSTFELRGPGSTLVSASVTYDAATRTARLTPSSALAGSTSYTASIRGGPGTPRIEDIAGNPATSTSWSFTTEAGPPPPSCPCSGWPPTTTPANPSVNDPNAIELGVKFRTDLNGFITGVRFYKGSGNTGTHVGNLWTSTGQLLASAVFSNETATGWQQVDFAQPVAVTANTVYVASYFAPNGNYAGDSLFFASSGIDNGPVHLLRDGVSGGNGVYGYVPTSSFPTQTFQSTNYWVDVVFTTTAGPDTTPPTVTATSPTSGATGVSPTTVVTATFNEAIDAATVNASTFELRNSANALVASTVSYDAATRTARLTPSSALATSATFTATLRGGATDPRIKDVSGNALAANVSWSFTTASGQSGCPCSGWPGTAVPTNPAENDPAAVEVGVKLRTDLDGFITGIRFYKASTNTGTHVANLWTSSGQLLATAVFTGETASGWQQVDFSQPIAITANTVYVASYFAPNGRYAADELFFASSGIDSGPVHLLRDGVSGGNGVYAYGASSSFPTQTFRSTNYWVDVVFVTSTGPDLTPPTVTSTSPPNGATAVNPTGLVVTATFNEAIDAATVDSSTFELRDSSSAIVASTVSYDAATRTASLTPSSALASSATFTATVHGGANDPRIKDVAGNALAGNVSWSFTTGVPGGVCAAPPNPIVAENCLAGNPDSEWDISGAGDSSIQGFATQISVNRGTTVSFKVDTNATNYRFDIYRMGYYGGMGARKITTVLPSAALPQNQPNCLNDAATGLIDCGNWAVSGSWAVPANAVSGIYFAKVVRNDNGDASHIVFIVRNDASTSDLLFQTSDTTWQAYNSYGGNSLYTGSPAGRAYKVSYNRPFNTRSVDNGQDWVFNAEYPMVRWLEANGYDVSYFTGVDSDRSGNLILNHRVFLSVGHDEYWSGTQRANVEAARNAGKHLAFFSGNEIFWKTRWENSIDASSTPHRTLVTYKETHANAKIDPNPAWTGTWRDPRFSPPADGGRPENALSGTIFAVNTGTSSIEVPEADGKMRFWRNTNIATLGAGQTATLPNGTLGYEWDIEPDNGARPPGLVRMSAKTVSGVDLLQDHGSTYGPGTATHHLTLYRHSSGALVFGAGTIQWAWGLDANHDRAGTPSDTRMRQATVNLFADMGVQPATLQAGLVAASASTDQAAPTSTIVSPAPGATVQPNSTVTITGTAADTGGGRVGGVEVSVDGGATWHPATGRANWTYSWQTGPAGSRTLRTRAADDSGNLETPGTGVTVNVGTGPDTTPPTITARSPTGGATGVAVDANVTATFNEAMDAATITSSSFELRDASNALVPAAVSYDAASRIATLNPTANVAGATTYTATVRGGTAGVKDSAGNALAADSTWSFTTDATPPTITTRSPAVGATGVSQAANVTATFSEPMDAATLGSATFELRDAANAIVPAVVSYDPATRIATLNPNANLLAQVTYTATVRGGASGVKDVAGNALAADAIWSFTTGGDATSPTITARSPAINATGVSQTANITATFNEAMDATTINTNTFELRGPGGALVAAVVSYNPTSRVATLNPSPTLAAQVAYTATVKGGANGVKDAAGNPLAADSAWSFTTGGDATPPLVTQTSPVNNATGVALSANATATFNEAMTSSSINTTTFTLQDPAGNLVAAGVSYSSSTRITTLNPSGNLALSAGTLYRATVKGGPSGVRDSAGNALVNDFSWSFTTVPLAITATAPASGATFASRTANITATFNGPMAASTINGTTFELRGPGGVPVPAVVSTTTLSAGNVRANLNPNSTLAALTTYTVTVKGGDAGVKTPTGVPLAADVVWSFTTGL